MRGLARLLLATLTLPLPTPERAAAQQPLAFELAANLSKRLGGGWTGLDPGASVSATHPRRGTVRHVFSIARMGFGGRDRSGSARYIVEDRFGRAEPRYGIGRTTERGHAWQATLSLRLLPLGERGPVRPTATLGLGIYGLSTLTERRITDSAGVPIPGEHFRIRESWTAFGAAIGVGVELGPAAWPIALHVQGRLHGLPGSLYCADAGVCRPHVGLGSLAVGLIAR
jgi:hypothetical protein